MVQIDRRHLILLCSCLLMASLIYSPFLLSVSMWGFAVASLIDFKWGGEGSFIKLDMAAVRRMLRIYRYPSFFAVTFFFFLVMLSFRQSYDDSYWLVSLRVKIPFLIFPLMFLAIPRFEEKDIDWLSYMLLWMMAVTCVGIGVNYGLHFEEINELMKQGQPMPTPRHHTRFSLLLALTILYGAHLIQKKYYWKKPVERKFILGLTAFLFVFIHILSVRSGLFTLYFSIVLLSFYYIYKSRKYWQALAVIAVLALMPVLAYHLAPSFQSKLKYVRYDFYMYQKGEGEIYADSGRITSLKAGWEIARQHPWFGVGIGNLHKEVKSIFDEKYKGFPEPYMPHNQFLFVLAGGGIFGLSLFLYAFLFPLFYQKNYRYLPLQAFFYIFFSSFLIEHTIENSLNVGMYVFFLLLILNFLNRKD